MNCALTLLALLCIPLDASAQEEEGGWPYSSGPGAPPLVHLTPSLEFELGSPQACGAPLHLGLQNSGRWYELANGSRLWRLRVAVPGATAMALEFKHYALPEGATLFVFDDSKQQIHGAFGAALNPQDGRLGLHPIRAAALTLEYHEPKQTNQPGLLVLGALQASAEPLAKAQDPRRRGRPAACQVDVACEEGLAWAALTRSIVKIEGIQNCTGVLLNNAREDGTPYVLTAQHCGSLNLANFWFQWQRKQCGLPLVRGSQKFASIFGSTLMVESRIHDFQLIRLNKTPSLEMQVHYAGWDRSEAIPETVTCLHHPWGDVMKISMEHQKPLMHQLYWKIRRWDLGITERGSSGAPLFDQEQRVVGQLKGGPATCKRPGGDLFGRLGPEWELLQPFLDPDGGERSTLDGMDIGEQALQLKVIGFPKSTLRPTEKGLRLGGRGFSRAMKVFLDDQRLPVPRARLMNNSSLKMSWAGLSLGKHLIRLQTDTESVDFEILILAANE